MRRGLRPLRVSTGRSDPLYAALAPMVDVLTILLVFLLRTWSTDPPVRPDDPSFQLPLSVEEAPVGVARRLDLAEGELSLNGARIASTKAALERDEAVIPELVTALAADPDAPLHIRVDADLPYALLRQALSSAQAAGVRDVTLVAASRAGL